MDTLKDNYEYSPFLKILGNQVLALAVGNNISGIDCPVDNEG